VSYQASCLLNPFISASLYQFFHCLDLLASTQ
jgi:hypothetical protein